MKRTAAIVGVVLGLMAGGAQASFLGRDANNQAANCSVSGADKCVSFYNDTLNITILNNWNIGSGVWDGSASPSATSVQGIAATAGFNATGLSGWLLPTENRDLPAGPSNQYKSIMQQVGFVYGQSNSDGLSKLRAQFYDVQDYSYWSRTEYSQTDAWLFGTTFGSLSTYGKSLPLFAVAVLDCDVADPSCQTRHPALTPVPTPATIALLGLGLVGIGAARRKQA